MSRLVHATIANSESSRQSVIEQENADPNSVVVIPNGVDLDIFRPQTKKKQTSNSDAIHRIGMLANLRPVKRVDDLIRGAARILDSASTASLRLPDLVLAGTTGADRSIGYCSMRKAARRRRGCACIFAATGRSCQLLRIGRDVQLVAASYGLRNTGSGIEYRTEQR